MIPYLVLQISKGSLEYTAVVNRFPKYKEAIDALLIEQGKEHLIKMGGDE